MSNYYKDLPPDLAKSFDDELTSQSRQVFDKVVETDWRLTQHNFLVNAGGAVAVLAYLGSNSTKTFAIWSLICFVIGIVASGIEIRTLLSFFGSLHKDTLRRRLEFVENKILDTELGPPVNVGGCAVAINHWCGWIAQIAFVTGIFIGISLFVMQSCNL